MRIVRSFGQVSRISALPNLRRAYGVPGGGPADLLSYRCALALGADPNQVIEVMGGGIEITVDDPTVFAVVGAEGTAIVDGIPRHSRNGRLRVERTLELAAPQRGWVTYVAPAIKPGEFALGHPASVDESAPLRISPSPDGYSQTELCERDWTITLDSDRRGTRLLSERIASIEQGPSEMAVPGLIQLPPSGLPIILGPAGPTVGGYAKLGVLLSPDRCALAQKTPGTVVSFVSVTWEEAEQAEVAFDAALNETVARLAWL